MAEDYAIKEGTSGVALEVTVLTENDDPVDFSEAVDDDRTVMFTMRPEDSETAVFTKQARFGVPPTKGKLIYDWAVGDTDTPGTYFGEFTVDFPSGPATYPSSGYIMIEVLPNLTEGVEIVPEFFCTTAEVRKITRQSVTEETLAMASSMVAMLVGRSPEDMATIGQSDIETGGRDAYWLKLATAWQATWVEGQPDILSRWRLKEVTQSGYAVKPHILAEFYGPGCTMAASHISWMRSRKIRVRRSRGAAMSRNFLGNDQFAGTRFDSGWTNLHH